MGELMVGLFVCVTFALFVVAIALLGRRAKKGISPLGSATPVEDRSQAGKGAATVRPPAKPGETKFKSRFFDAVLNVKVGDVEHFVGLWLQVERDGRPFFDALQFVEDCNRRKGTAFRLIDHRTAEALLALGKHNEVLRPYSPFWTGTIIATESRTKEKLGEKIYGYHHPADKPLVTVNFLTEQFKDHAVDCALTMEGVCLADFSFDDGKHQVTVDPKGRAKLTEQFPMHPKQLFLDSNTGVPCYSATEGRALWCLREDRPVWGSGGREYEAVNPYFDNYVTAIVRSAPLSNATQADQAFSADSDLFKCKWGVLVEISAEDLKKI